MNIKTTSPDLLPSWLGTRKSRKLLDSERETYLNNRVLSKGNDLSDTVYTNNYDINLLQNPHKKIDLNLLEWRSRILIEDFSTMQSGDVFEFKLGSITKTTPITSGFTARNSVNWDYTRNNSFIFAVKQTNYKYLKGRFMLIFSTNESTLRLFCGDSGLNLDQWFYSTTRNNVTVKKKYGFTILPTNTNTLLLSVFMDGITENLQVI